MSLHTFALLAVNAITFLNDTLYKIPDTYVCVCISVYLEVCPPFNANTHSLFIEMFQYHFFHPDANSNA